jgi:two-component system sensor histidine kinase DctS
MSGLSDSLITTATSRWRRALPWVLLVVMLGIAQSLLLVLTVRYEHDREQERTELALAAAVGDVRQLFAGVLQSLHALVWSEPTPAEWRAGAADLLRQRREVVRVEWRGSDQQIEMALDSPYRAPLFTMLPRSDFMADSEAACATAMRLAQPIWSRSYFVPQDGGMGYEVIDVCLPTVPREAAPGAMVATIILGQVLGEAVKPELARQHELSFVEPDGSRLARSGFPRGAGVFVAERLIDLPGANLVLRLDSARRAPGFVANLATSLVLGLSLALAVVVAMLVRDVRRRAAAEASLAEELALRRAMENSLVTGLRARDMAGRVTYVNPAFCVMVGFTAEQLIGQTTPPYWPPEMRAAYEARHAARLQGGLTAQESREGHETTFMRADGERFPVLIFEAPLIGTSGAQTGWMSAVLDLSSQKRAEELSRQQQERLQASARLATVGEMASLLSHELNQPLAAIASYASGSLNLLEPGSDHLASDAGTLLLVRQATQRVAEQAERAGRVIKSVHDFVRRREHRHEEISCEQLVETVLPLVRLQARKNAVRIELDLGEATTVVCDCTMVEQVLVNLTRNAIQAMESTPAALRVLRIGARIEGARVRIAISDHGPGIAPDVARRLFTPFFTTKSEGMGLGLSLCRTVIEQHGGMLEFETLLDAHGLAIGTRFSFTLPAATNRELGAAAALGVVSA